MLTKKKLRVIVGWSLIAVGFIGLFLPFLQGVLFMVLGVIILAPVSPMVHRFALKLERRYPQLFEKARLFRKKKYRW